MARRSPRKRPITHEQVAAALRRFRLRGGRMRKGPAVAWASVVALDVLAARFEARIGDYQGLIEL